MARRKSHKIDTRIIQSFYVRCAKKALRVSEPMAKVLYGMTKAEARNIVSRSKHK